MAKRKDVFHGVLHIDKAAGLSSNDVLTLLKRAFRIGKAGHNGTLDPFASGVLSCFIGEGTKLIPFLETCKKSYRATVRLGMSTTTGDYAGTVVEECTNISLSLAALQQAIPSFLGTIAQRPPMFSAIKQQGQPLYELARQGVAVEREARLVEVFSIELIDVHFPFVTLDITCGSGVYVRTLCEDLFACLSIPSHLVALRRTRNGNALVDQCLPQSALRKDAHENFNKAVNTIDQALSDVFSFAVPEAAVTAVSGGNFGPLFGSEIILSTLLQHEVVALRAPNGRLLALMRQDKPNFFGLKRVFALDNHETEQPTDAATLETP